MRFPKLLKFARFKGDKVAFPEHILDADEDGSLVREYERWKQSLGVPHMTRRKLLKMYEDGVFKAELLSLFKKQAKIGG